MVTSLLRKKVDLVTWSVVCKSKDQGGLGMIDLNIYE